MEETFDGNDDVVDRALEEYLGERINNLSLLDKENDGMDLTKNKFLRSLYRINERLFERLNYIAPNERNPRESFPILQQAPAGVFISVGTERGFIGATFAENTTHLILADADAGVVLFNRMNIALLKLSDDLKDYKRLRFKMSFAELSGRVAQSNLLSEKEKLLLTNEKAFYFWGYYVRTFFFLNPYSVWAALPNFWRSHYLYSKERFLKLQTMAKSGNIQSVRLNFNDNAQTAMLAKYLSLKKLFMNVLDISNAWWPVYLDRPNLERTLIQLDQVSDPKSIFMITTKKNFGYKIKQIWGFYGFLFKDIIKLTRHGELDQVLDKFQKLKKFKRGEVQNLSDVLQKVQNTPEIPEEKLNLLASFKLISETSGPFQNKVRNNIQGTMAEEALVVSASDEEKIVAMIKNEITHKNKNASDPFATPAIVVAWFDLPIAARHPEIVDEMIQSGAYDTKVFNLLFLGWTQSHPEWIDYFIKKGGYDGDIIQKVFSRKQWADRYGLLIEEKLKDGRNARHFAHFVLSQSWTRSHPEWVELLIKNAPNDEMVDAVIQEYVLNKPFWRNQPALRRIAGKSRFLSSKPTVESLRAAFARGESVSQFKCLGAVEEVNPNQF